MFDTITALYVEDEEELRNIVVNISQRLFKRIITANNGQEGWDLFQEHKDVIDLVITDINMPKMNGLDMCRKIRQIDQKIPVIITTAHSDKDFLHKAITIGVSEYIEKPMDMHNLIATVKKSLQTILLEQKFEEEQRLHQEERVSNAKFMAIGQLAAGITHEINTPLTYIKANFEMLNYDIDDLEESKIKTYMKKNVAKINDGLLRIENIISSMKEMSQQSRQKKERTNVYSTIITSSVLAYNKIKHISNIYINGDKFSLGMDKKKYIFEIDVQKQRIEQVWIIIINNAMDELVKIDGYENRKLYINIVKLDDGIKVIFKDNAGGIKDEIFEHLFDPFKSTKESSGMGVGLSIAKKIVEAQDATIEARNEEIIENGKTTKGAVFEIVFSDAKLK